MKKKGSDAPPAALVQLSGPLGGAPFFPGWRGLRSEKYESEKTKADGPWGGWVGIPRQMKIEVGGSKVLWSRCSICRDVFVCLEAPASGTSSPTSRCRSADPGV